MPFLIVRPQLLDPDAVDPAEQDHPAPRPPGEIDPEAGLAAALGERYTVAQDHRRRADLTFLDTADRRLRSAGLDLHHDRQRRHLVLVDAAGRVEEQPHAGPPAPVRLERLAAGPVTERLRKPVWVRALVPYAEVAVTATTYAVRNADDKIVARICWSRGDLAGSSAALPERIDVERLRGYDKEADQIEARLARSSGLGDGAVLATGADPWLTAVRARRVPGEPPAAPESMRADEPGDVAVARALLGYLDELEAATEGTVADLDSEYLHDFRVAVRRTRSVLKLLGDVLPGDVGAEMAAEFRWLGDVTTPTRDLDVYLLELPDLCGLVTRPDDLAGFGTHVAARRAAALRALRRSLRSSRFATLRARWREALGDAVQHPAPGGPTALALADERLHRTYRKVVKRADVITDASTSEQIHDLRKACKALRYLLEVFKPLCDPAAYKRVIADFKDLQDVLGEFQDGEVQAAALHTFAGEMLASGSARADTVLAMGELSGHFDHRQRSARARLTEHHRTRLGPRVARHVDRLIPGGSRP